MSNVIPPNGQLRWLVARAVGGAKNRINVIPPNGQPGQLVARAREARKRYDDWLS